MDRETILAMDSYILLSWLNMKLRDEFDSLELLCEEFGVDADDLVEKLHKIGYRYNRTTNQFISEDA
ncbi:DUF4250 domain-containing protein [Fonticella tunisiensis]|uniref:Uncharacterized protein DUF4250 n=1 Tax=Fonticella tunisiensis TaxID=1096341 RepID=A0A4R7KTE3_9CLOT|nr:DUF4250 domain-containing protein [Fonticella tunisiensis]TDT61158.1 uncharacterized protein DUF4250 [Fonticella tunisiensis]